MLVTSLLHSVERVAVDRDQPLENLPRMMNTANAMMAKTMRIVINKTGSPLCR